MLLEAGHDVAGTTRTTDKLAGLARAGAEPVVMDGLDAGSVTAAVTRARPDVVIHQLTALSRVRSLRKFDEGFAPTNRLRTTGTDHLLAAARTAGVRRFVAQSFTGWTNERVGGPVKDESSPLDPHPTPASRQTLAAIAHVEKVVPAAPDLDGLVLRYGGFYGLGAGGDLLELIRSRKLPIVGGGTGIWSLVHIDDAARATLCAVQRGAPGVYNIVDDDPAPVSEWLPLLAEVIGAKPPLRIPAWLARPMIGAHGVSLMTQVRGSSNAKAKRELGWSLTYPTWREGFRSDWS
jgi:2-alkyl-3-oxoalkanoate reductase